MYYYDYSTVPYTGLYAEVYAKTMMAYSIISILILVLQTIALWRIFNKAGEKGWKSIIPVYNFITLFRIAGISPWFILGYLAMIIPIIGYFVVLGIIIYMAANLAKSFGKGSWFTAGLVFLGPIFYMILGFGRAEYIGNTAKTTEM